MYCSGHVRNRYPMADIPGGDHVRPEQHAAYQVVAQGTVSGRPAATTGPFLLGTGVALTPNAEPSGRMAAPNATPMDEQAMPGRPMYGLLRMIEVLPVLRGCFIVVAQPGVRLRVEPALPGVLVKRHAETLPPVRVTGTSCRSRWICRSCMETFSPRRGPRRGFGPA